MAVRSDVSHDCASVGTTTNPHTNYSKDGQIPGDYILFVGAQILSTITTLLSLTHTKYASAQIHRAERAG
jgi:hypothetical protein